MNTVLTSDAIRLSGTATSKDEAIAEVGTILVSAGAVTPEYVESMFARESLVSTYMGNLLAIPHGTNEAKDEILHSAVAFIRYNDELDWNGNPVRFVIGIAGKGDAHMEVLSALALTFSDMSAVERLLSVTSNDEVLTLLGLNRI